MIYVVLGMHKSGTTLVSQILHHSGINMGESINPEVSYDAGNKYERQSTLALDAELLGLKSMRAGSLGAQVPAARTPTESQRARMRAIIQGCGAAHADWGFKDPRACLVYHLWSQELPEHKIIAVYRPVEEVWPRYREQRFYRAFRNPSRAWTLVKAWCRYNASLLGYLQVTDMGFLVLSYRDLVTADAELDRLRGFVGCELSDQRQPALYRSRSEKSWLLAPHSWLARWRLGCRPKDLLDRFEALRRNNLPELGQAAGL